MTFLTWILAGLLAGLLAGWVMKRGSYGLSWDITLGLVGSIGGSWILRSLGFYPGAGIIATAVVAFIVAVIPIVAQRKFWATERPIQKKDTFWRWGLGAALVALVAWMTLGPVQQPAAVAAPIEERTYAVMPPSLKVNAGIVVGEVTDMKVAERVEKGSDRIVTAAKLHGDAQAEEHVGQPDGAAARGEAPLYRCPGITHQARGTRGPNRPSNSSTYGSMRAPRSRAGGHPAPGRGVPRRGLAAEGSEGDPPRVRVYPVTLSGGDGQLPRLDRPGQIASPSRGGSPEPPPIQPSEHGGFDE